MINQKSTLAQINGNVSLIQLCVLTFLLNYFYALLTTFFQISYVMLR